MLPISVTNSPTPHRYKQGSSLNYVSTKNHSLLLVFKIKIVFTAAQIFQGCWALCHLLRLYVTLDPLRCLAYYFSEQTREKPSL